MKAGVPQGSILGHLLFVIFANDLPFLLTCHLDTYADDSTLTSTKKDINSINYDMNNNCSKVFFGLMQIGCILMQTKHTS